MASEVGNGLCTFLWGLQLAGGLFIPLALVVSSAFQVGGAEK